MKQDSNAGTPIWNADIPSGIVTAVLKASIYTITLISNGYFLFFLLIVAFLRSITTRWQEKHPKLQYEQSPTSKLSIRHEARRLLR